MLVLNLNLGGQLTPSSFYPAASKTKSCYFIRRDMKQMPKDDLSFKANLIYGDLSHHPMEHMVTFVENVS